MIRFLYYILFFVSLCAVNISYAGQYFQVEPRLNLADIFPEIATNASKQGVNPPMLLNLWASWCKPCLEEIPLMEQARVDHANLSIIYVVVGEDSDASYNFLLQLLRDNPAQKGKYKPLKRHQVMRVSHKKMQEMGLRGIPVTLLVNHQHDIYGYYLGDYDWVRDDLSLIASLND